MRRTICLALLFAVGVLGALAQARTAQALTVSGSLRVDLGEVEPGVLYRAGSFWVASNEPGYTCYRGRVSYSGGQEEKIIPPEWVIFRPERFCLNTGEWAYVEVDLFIEPNYPQDQIGGRYHGLVLFCTDAPPGGGISISLCVGGRLFFTVPLPIRIDIRPDSDENPVHIHSRGKIPVAILSAPGFDAPSRVNRETLTFGRTGTEPSLAFCNSEAEDVNGDGLPDLICHFYASLTGFTPGDSHGILRGRTLDSIPLKGRDTVRMLPTPHGYGHPRRPPL